MKEASVGGGRSSDGADRGRAIDDPRSRTRVENDRRCLLFWSHANNERPPGLP